MPSLSALQAQTADDPLTQALTRYLVQRGALPVIQENRTTDGSQGQFSYGDAYPPQGALTVAPNATAGTYAHELTHAAQRQLVEQYYHQIDGREAKDPAFVDAYNKLQFRGAQQDLMQRLGGSFAKENEGYRTSATEAPAFAVGNMVDNAHGGYTWPAPAHIDPTMASELAMLLEIASRKGNGK
jgi:hypothetical protein